MHESQYTIESEAQVGLIILFCLLFCLFIFTQSNKSKINKVVDTNREQSSRVVNYIGANNVDDASHGSMSTYITSKTLT